MLVEASAREIHVPLHFLSSGTHVRETVPEWIDATRARHAGSRIADLAVDRFDDVMPDGRGRADR